MKVVPRENPHTSTMASLMRDFMEMQIFLVSKIDEVS